MNFSLVSPTQCRNIWYDIFVNCNWVVT